MQQILFESGSTVATIAILCKASSFHEKRLVANYVKPLMHQNVQKCSLMAFSLPYQTKTKCNAQFAKDYLQVLLPKIAETSITTLFVADNIYFKYLTNIKKTMFCYGYIYPCAIEGYEHLQVILAPNYQAIIYNPALQEKLDLAVTTLSDYYHKIYSIPGTDIIKTAEYPKVLMDIEEVLEALHIHPILTCDIETKGLKFYNCGISTISFAWDEHHGVAFGIGRNEQEQDIKEALKTFLETYQGTLIFHNATFDIKVLVFNLWMDTLGDVPGMFTGIDCLTRDIDDTKLIAYLALNNTIETKLSLKYLAFDFAGDYGEEGIENTDSIELPALLAYNLKDCLCTWYVMKKYAPLMLQDKQKSVYENIFNPGIAIILQMELTGMPIDPIKVAALKKTLLINVKVHEDFFQNYDLVKEFHLEQLEEKAAIATSKAVKKVYTIYDSVIAFEFNPNSDLQLQKFIYSYMGYDVIDTTKGGAPAVGTGTLKKLIHKAKRPEHKVFFQHLIDHALADKILTSFIPHFEEAQQLPDGTYRLFGNFNQGGTKSGRQSSSNPNLQNLPSSSVYGKAVKACFISPGGTVFAGSDFDSLEDKVNALITKDPNKRKVYTDGYDGHSLRAHSYFGEQMPDIVNTVNSINSIASKYKHLRQESKAPTFALTYAGNYMTLMNNNGFSEKVAKGIEANFKKLYTVSLQWVADKLDQAAVDGYVTCAFGLRLRTPILAQTVATSSTLPQIAQKERRSAGNAVSGQSYGLLTMRAGIEFYERCRKSEYRCDILQVAHIHDAIYLLVKDKADVIKWVNDNLIECMAWQHLPELQHNQIKISSGLEVYYPDWSEPIEIPNNVTKKQLIQIAKEK